MKIDLNSRPKRQNLGFWEAFAGALVNGFASGGGGASGGNVTPPAPSNVNTNNLFTQISPSIQTQISPNISPVFQQVQTSGGGAGGQSTPINLIADIAQSAPATFTAAPSQDIRQNLPASVPVSVPVESAYQNSPAIQTQISPNIPVQSANYLPWILGGLAVIVVIKAIR